MNDSNNPINPKPLSEQKKIEKETTNAQVPLPRALSQQIKEGLKKLKADTRANYSQSDFLALVIEGHWVTEMEQLRKNLEKIKKSKG